MSSPVRPDAAFRELELLVRNLGEELSAFRKRAQAAEARLKAIATSGGGGDARAEERVAMLEKENAILKSRLESSAERTRAMLDRVRFLRQQHAGEGR
ncbi:MAG: hypothetical protein NTU67_08135 [Gemmatimonadetes bacterium]|nr:hypothetical protein [Gemmatimonadota bacterium]